MAEWTQQQIETLVKSQVQMTEYMRAGSGLMRSSSGSSGFSSNSSRRSRSNDKDAAEEEYVKTTKSVSQAMKEYLSGLKQNNGIINEHAVLTGQLNAAVENSMSGLHRAAQEYRRLAFKSLPDQISMLNNFNSSTKDLTTEMTKNIRKSSILGAAMIDGHNAISSGSEQYRRMIDRLTTVAATQNQGILKNMGLINEATGEISDNLDSSKFADLMVELGNVQTTIAEGASKLGFASFSELLKKAGTNIDEAFEKDEIDKVKSGIMAMAVQLQSTGHDLGGIKLIDSKGNVDAERVSAVANNPEDLNKVMHVIDESSRQAAAGLGAMSKEAKIAGTTFGQLKDSLKVSNIAGSLKKWVIGLGAAGVAASQFRQAMSDAKRGVGEITDFNIQQVPKSFIETGISAAKLGLSFSDNVKFMNQNRRSVALFGDGFDQYAGSLQGTFEKFGFSMEQAADIVGPAAENAQAAGVNMKDAGEMNSWINDSMKSFQSLSAITGITGEQYQALNAQLLNNTDVQKQLLGLDSAHAVAAFKDLEAERERLVLLGLTNEQANQVLQAQAAAQRAPVVERMRASAAAGMLGQQSGLSAAESKDFASLVNNPFLDQDPEGRKRLTELSARVNTGMEKARRDAMAQGGIGAESAVQTMQERLQSLGGSSLSGLLSSAMPRSQAQRSNAEISKTQAAAMGEKTKGSEAGAEAINAVNSVTSIMKNGFGAALVHAVLGLNSVAVSSLIASKGLAGVGLGGGLGGLGGKAKGAEAAAGKVGALGKLGKVGKIGGKVLGKLAAPLAVGIGAYEAFTGVRDAGKEESAGKITHQEATKKKGEAIGDAAGGLAGMAAGAAIGSVVPVIGTIIGGAIGYFGGAQIGNALGGLIGSHVGKPDVPPAIGQPNISAPPRVGMAGNAITSPSAVSGDLLSKAQNLPEGMVATPAKDSTALVKDLSANGFLSNIASSTDATVKLLQQLTSLNAPTSPSLTNNEARPVIPTTTSFITGRQPA